ncbi:MAG: hypothetical protein JRI68_22645 [Deltaproteobacteria bacterium]|nr:hypothetical protein [Deltaproteobacteria bacterium]
MSAIVLTACGGGLYAGEQVSLVVGRVTDQADSSGVENIEVCLEIPDGSNTVRTCASTGSTGHYDIVEDEYLEQLATDRTSTLAVSDVDGDAHGAYLDQDVEIPPANLPMTIDVELEPASN